MLACDVLKISPIVWSVMHMIISFTIVYAAYCVKTKRSTVVKDECGE